MNPNQHPNTILTLSAYPALDKVDARTPNRWTRLSLKRVLDTRRRIERLQWAARAEVIRDQLRAQRGTFA